MKKYVRSKTFINRATRERIEIDRTTKTLTIKYCVGDGYYKHGQSYDCYTFVDTEGNTWGYNSPVDYNGTAKTAIGKMLQELDIGDSVIVSGYFIPSGRANIEGPIINPRLLRR